MNDLERSLIDEETMKMFADFRDKHTLESVYAELNKLPNTNQVIRLMGTENISCDKCKKKAVYLRPLNNTYLCWKHGYELVKV